MRSRVCIVCGSPLSGEPLASFDNMPASAQDIPSKEELDGDQGITLKLHQCEVCGLVQFDCEPVAYYKDVIRSGGFTSTMVNLRRKQYGHFIEAYELEGKKLLEAGCGQGEFLELLSEFPVKAYGMEHRESLAALAREKGLAVWRQFAEEGQVLASPDGNAAGPYDGFLSFNFLEHQPKPVDMLRCIAENLCEGGVGLVTVPSLEYILQYDGYYELIRDHLAYYTFDTLRFTMEEAGFSVVEEEMVNRDTLSVIVKKKGRGETRDFAGQSGHPRTIKKVDVSGLIESQTVIRKELAELAEQLKAGNLRLALWGASHQGFTLASTTAIGSFAEYIIDSAPFKQGKYAPVSHLPIVSPGDFAKNPVSAILIAAPGYTKEIREQIRKMFGEEIEVWALKSNHLERM